MFHLLWWPLPAMTGFCKLVHAEDAATGGAGSASFSLRSRSCKLLQRGSARASNPMAWWTRIKLWIGWKEWYDGWCSLAQPDFNTHIVDTNNHPVWYDDIVWFCMIGLTRLNAKNHKHLYHSDNIIIINIYQQNQEVYKKCIYLWHSLTAFPHLNASWKWHEVTYPSACSKLSSAFVKTRCYFLHSVYNMGWNGNLPTLRQAYGFCQSLRIALVLDGLGMYCRSMSSSFLRH